jgi:septal ring factor EnvC (AmiA/AmiB activator)
MGIAAYNRGTRVIAQQIAREQAEHQEEFGYQIAAENKIREQSERIKLLEMELNKVQREMKRAQKAYHCRGVMIQVLKEEVTVLNRRVERIKSFSAVRQEKLEIVCKAYKKLRQILKLALIPEQYHHYLEIVEELLSVK